MRQCFTFLTLLSFTWTYPHSKFKWEDIPMRRMFVDPQVSEVPKSHPGPRIVNGYEVAPHEIPYQAWIVFRISEGSNGWGCGGSLITKRYVLTAAHCILWAGLAEVHLGIHNISSNEDNNSIMVKSTTLLGHANYNASSITNDIGVIDLEQEMELNEYINVAKLPRSSDLDQLYEGENARVSGWGLIAGGGNQSQVLLAVNSTVLTNAACKAVFSIVKDSEICISGEGGVGTCSGDSGGPLVVGDVQVGIVSYGTRDCVYGYPSVFTRITSFLSWIEEHTDYVIEE